MEESRPLEVDIILPQEGKNISEEVNEGAFKNVFTRDNYSTEREVVASYDALNKGMIVIDEIRSDFGRMSNPIEIVLLQKELKKLMPDLDIEINGQLNLKTEKALREYEKLLGLM